MKAVRVLLIEDDPDSADALQLLLRSGGYEVECLATAHDTIALFKRDPHHPSDVMVIDLMLPDMDGITLVENLRTMTELPPLVIHSAASIAATQAAAQEIGAAAVLRKPAVWQEMREVLERVVSTRQGNRV